MPALPRGTCRECRQDVALRKGGRTREHRLKRTIYPLAVKGQICPGSGRLADEHFGGKRG